jgi:hypothetical protein
VGKKTDNLKQCCGSGSKVLAESGENNFGSRNGQLRIRNEFQIKLLGQADKINNLSTKCTIFKNPILFKETLKRLKLEKT